jgi:GNAT superfamily N-acetyltransferase
MVGGPQLLYAGRVGTLPSPSGAVVVLRSPWEEAVVGRPFAKLALLAAEDFSAALGLARAAVAAAHEAGVVLMTASPGDAPNYVTVALEQSGFHLGSQALTLRADLELVWRKLAAVPAEGDFRLATPSDAPAMAAVARKGFDAARFTADPFFPREWGNELYAAWAASLAAGDEHEVIVFSEGGRIRGFANVQRDVERRPRVPGLFVVDRELQGSGVGPRLLRQVIARYRESGAHYPFIGTEKTNVDVNSMFFRLGYWLEDSSLVLHWTPPGQTSESLQS